MPVKVKGLEGVQKAFLKYPEIVNELVEQELHEYGQKMVDNARRDHRFRSSGTSRSGYRRTGNAERSIQFRVLKRKRRVSGLKFWINPSRVTRNNYNYALIQNDGFGQGYSRGSISPSLGTKVSTQGLRADDFMGRAWEKYTPDLIKSLGKATRMAKVRVIAMSRKLRRLF